jgi:hypothetical protein
MSLQPSNLFMFLRTKLPLETNVNVNTQQNWSKLHFFQQNTNSFEQYSNNPLKLDVYGICSFNSKKLLFSKQFL